MMWKEGHAHYNGVVWLKGAIFSVFGLRHCLRSAQAAPKAPKAEPAKTTEPEAGLWPLKVLLLDDGEIWGVLWA